MLQDGNAAEFWEDIYPKLQSLETQTWNNILVDSKKQHHTIDVEKLNSRAVAHLEEIRYDTQGMQLVSLRLDSTHRLYGFRQNGVFYILWYDRNHGDNDTCVVRSAQRHT